jgi:hypothetical protein
MTDYDDRLAAIEQRQRDQAAVLASLESLQKEHAKLSELVADLVVKTEKPGRMPRPTPQWHSLTDEERAAELGKLKGYEKEILPLLGHLGKKLGPCWQQHPLACIALEIIGELWQTLFMTDRRPPSILHGQADFMIRVLPGLFDLIAKETNNCTHSSGLGNLRAAR